jgi:type VII secretion protein EccB
MLGAGKPGRSFMPSRRDQLHAAQFSTQRVVAALTTHDPDPTQSPFRNVTVATAVGLLVCLLIAGGTAVYAGWTGDTGKDWRDENAVFIEKDSGATYVYLADDQKLHPVLNYTSGLLLTSGTSPQPVTMSRRTLSDAPRGARLGIADAPGSLPTRKDLLSDPWVVCSQRDAVSGAPTSQLVIGDARGGHVLAPADNAAPEALLAALPNGRQYLIYNGHKFALPQPQLALAALGMTGSPTVVAPAVLNSLPTGADVRAPAVPNSGQASAALSGAKVGQLYVATAPGGTRAYGVVLTDGLGEISEVQANLLAADPQSGAAGRQPTELSITAYAALRRSRTKLSTESSAALPKTTPKAMAAGTSVCVSVRNTTESGTRVLLNATIADNDLTVTDSPGVTTSGTPLANKIMIRRGRGVIVEALASATATTGALSLVTDSGTRYAIADREVLGRLGYGGVKPVRLPSELVAMLPAGPALDPAAARRPAAS